jgi:hypothetical protein
MKREWTKPLLTDLKLHMTEMKPGNGFGRGPGPKPGRGLGRGNGKGKGNCKDFFDDIICDPSN